SRSARARRHNARMLPRRACVAVASLTMLLTSAFARAQGAPADDSWKNPAKAADPPVLPPPPPGPPTSPSGTDLIPPEPAAPPTVALPDREEEAKQDARVRALEDRAARDETRIRALEERLGLLRHLKIGAYIQPQFLTQSFNSAASPNLQPNGLLPPG